MAVKRGKPPQRKRPLKADVEKVREFLQRGRQPLERSGLRRSKSGFRSPDAREGPLTPAAWRQAVHDASEGRCVITRSRALNADDRRFEAHHPLAKRELRSRGLHGYVWDARNGVWLRGDVHRGHEDAFERVPAEKLPASVWEFCAELDALAGSGWATAWVLRYHPAAGNSGISHEEDHDGEGRRDGR